MNDVEKKMREMEVGEVMQIRSAVIVCVPGGWVVDRAFVPKTMERLANGATLDEAVESMVSSAGSKGMLESQMHRVSRGWRGASKNDREQTIGRLIKDGVIFKSKPNGSRVDRLFFARCRYADS